MRKLLLIVALAACAKSSKEGAPSASEPARAPESAAPAPVVGGQPPPPPADPAETTTQKTTGAAPAPDKTAKEEARASGVLGPTDQDAFGPLEPYVAAIEKGPIAPLAIEVQRCYDKALAAKPGLVGTLELTFEYNADGTTAAVKVAKSTVKHAELERCIVELLKSAKLAPAKAAVKASARIAFKKQ